MNQDIFREITQKLWITGEIGQVYYEGDCCCCNIVQSKWGFVQIKIFPSGKIKIYCF